MTQRKPKNTNAHKNDTTQQRHDHKQRKPRRVQPYEYSPLLHDKRQKAAILDLIAQGFNFTAIARKLRIALPTVSRIYWSEIQRLDNSIKQHTDLLRARQLNDIYAMLDSIADKAAQGDPVYVDLKLKLMDREAKITGVIYPEEIPQQNEIIVVNFPGALPQSTQHNLDDGNTITISPDHIHKAQHTDND
jgi:hypothetical protein